MSLRTVQWGNNVFVAGNFSATAAQTVTVPSGTWYNYYLQKQETNATISLEPGELLILTGTQVALPEINDEVFIGADVNNVFLSQPQSQVEKFFYNGALYLRRGNQTYTVDGLRVE